MKNSTSWQNRLDDDIDPLTKVKSSPDRLDASGQILYPAAASNQVGCACAWQRSLFLEIIIRPPTQFSIPNTGWRGYHEGPNWSYYANKIQDLVARRTSHSLTTLWIDSDHWPYGECSFTLNSWWILHSWLSEYPLWDNSIVEFLREAGFLYLVGTVRFSMKFRVLISS